jgi:periplasmic divalent cation tolerance protein
MSEYLSLYITAPSFDVPDAIGRTLVEERLAACVNIIPEMHSIYGWVGNIEKAAEVVLIAKSRTALFGEIEERVRELHPYECPCLSAWPKETAR